MDKSWMSKDRLSDEYIQGVANFLLFANPTENQETCMRCPCEHCVNLCELSQKMVRNHLFHHGIDKQYTRWVFHGEKVLRAAPYFDRQDGFLHGMETPDNAASTKNLLQAGLEQYPGDPGEFGKLLEDAEKPLYEGCSKYTKLSMVVKLYNLKAKGGWSDKSFSELLRLFGDGLPEGNLLPSSMGKVKKMLSVYGMKYEKIHACPNDCILYRGDANKDRTTCPTCGVSRFKENKNMTETSKVVPAKVIWYFPPIPRFRKLFQSIKTAEDLTWHANEREVDEKLRHPADSPAWKSVDAMWPEFAADSRNLRLALSTDGFNPHGSLSSKYSCWPVMLITYNLPPWLCVKRKFMMLTMLISGPRQPGNDIDVYLQPLIDDLKVLWNTGVDVYDAYRQETFTLRAVLLWTINDFPAFGNLSGCCVKGYYACPVCGEKTRSFRLKHSCKIVYMATRRFLPKNHPFRKQRKAFYGKQEFELQPEVLDGDKVKAKVSMIKVSWGKKVKDIGLNKSVTPKWGKNITKGKSVKRVGKRKRQGVGGQAKSSTTPRSKHVDDGVDEVVKKCWKKKSVFFELDYWEFLLVRHILDVMHIEKNVCDSIIGTLLNIPSKTKDTVNGRLDLQDMGKDELAPKIGKTRTFLPPACYTLSRAEKQRVCQTLHELKVPEGYSSNFKPRVSMEDLKLQGLKSHDCHVLMQQLLPVAIRSVLPKHVRYTIIRLCFFFNALCAKVIDVMQLSKIQRDVVVTLCLLEKYFPPSFFDIMVHLTVHLVREVKLCGPVFFRWMYPFERYMSVLKGYVRNRNRPEGCMAENYIAEEAIEFCSEFLSDLDPIGVPANSKITPDDMLLEGITPAGGIATPVDGTALEQAHLYVLRNTGVVEPYIGEHMEYLKKKHPRSSKKPTWLQEEHNRTFSDWLKGRVSEERSIPNNKVSSVLTWIALGPRMHVLKYESYVINGYRFSTKDRDASRVNQNSGVSLVAGAMQVASAKDKNPAFSNMSFYGVVVEIWLLDYFQFHIPVFKCDWVESGNGIKTDDLGFTLVDLGRVGHKSEPFILASQAKQVFYVPDQLDPKWSIALQAPKRCYNVGDIGNDVFDGDIGDRVRPEVVPSVDSFDVNDESQPIFSRKDCEGIWVENDSSKTYSAMDPEDVFHSEDEKELSDTEALNDPEALSERGATIMHALSRKWDGIIINVEFNGKGKPIGQKVRSMLSGWEGALARALIPLSAFQTWKRAPDELLNLLWVGILIRFNIDVKYRKAVLKSIGVRWRTFKNMLTKKFIFPFKDDPDELTKPPKKYKIRKSDWHAFVKSRLTREFQERSKLQSARRKMNKYNHRISRLGYAGLEDKLKEELGESFDEDDRANLWLLARQDKNGGYYDDDTREVAEKIDQLKKKEADGKLITQGRDDVLSKALGTSEHCGRVRAGGKYVTPTTYFNIPKKGSKAHRAEMESRIRKKEEENKALKERVRQLEALGIIQGITTNLPELAKVASNSSKNDGRKRMSSPLDDQLSHGANNMINYECLNIELEANMRKKCKQTTGGAKSKSDEAISKPKYVKGQAMGLQNRSVAKAKCNVAVAKPTPGNEQVMGSKSDVAISKPKSGNVTCKLALESKDNVVADASLIEGSGPDEKIHNVILGEGYVRVHIIRAISMNAILPRPVLDDDVTTVGGAVGYIVAWPREFVLLGDNAISKPKSGNLQAIRSKDNNMILEANKDVPISKSKSGNVKFPMCKLILESKGNVVADACLIEGSRPDEMINDGRLGEGYVRVQILRAIFATALLPRPIFDDDITTVGGAVGYHVDWPRDFVLLENMTDEVECDEFDECTLKEFGVLVGSVMKGNHISQMDTKVFERELQFFIAKDEIMDICQPKNLLNANCIIAYIRYLFEKYESSQQRFGFCYPADFSRYADKKEMSRFFLNRLQARRRDQVIFLPYNPGNHWVLVMIDISAKEVYYLDSIGREPDIKLKVMVNTGIKTLALGEGKRVEPKWQRVQCPKQQGDFECGYYIMQFMRHFMKDPNQSLKTKLMELADTRTYTNADLIEIRLEFIEYIEKFIST